MSSNKIDVRLQKSFFKLVHMLMCRTEQLLVLLCIVLHQGTIDLCHDAS